ncbi:hypothetical protein [Dyella flagellata]|nr:hypothetical protein [Dyella flagellata]
MPQLGDSANLLLGLAPGWHGGSGAVLPYAAAPNKALCGIDTPASLPTGNWGGLQLSFHPSIASLIDALFDYRLRPLRAMSGQLDLRASNLMLGAGQRAQAIDTLASLLALAPAQLAAGRLVLLQMTRIDAELRHPLDEGGIGRPIHVEHYWTREGRHAIGRLRVARQPIVNDDVEHALIGRHEAGRYFDYLYDYGSHFISCLRMGDKYFQVLACQPQRYDLLQKLWLPLIGQGDAGPALQGLVNYLGGDWITATGRVASASNHVFDGDAWHVPNLPTGHSLLAPLLRQAEALPAGWSVPIGIEFSPHSPYMERQRAIAWQQVYQGAMLQRFGDGASWSNGIAKLASPSRIHSEHASAQGGDISELVGIHPSHDTFHGDLFASRLPVHGEMSWTVQAGASLLALTMDAQAADGCVPRMRLRGSVSSECQVFTGKLRGALLIELADGRLEALFAGLRFAAGTQGRPTVSAELSRPDSATLIRLRLPLLVLLTDAEARWTRASADRDPAEAHAIRGEIAWLLRAVLESGVMHADATQHAFWIAFCKRAALLAHCGPGQAVAPASTANMEWMQAANVLLFRLRLDQPSGLPASELASIDQALLRLLEQARPDAAAPDKATIDKLDACLQQLEQVRHQIALASQALLQRAEPIEDAEAARLLTQLIPSREDSVRPPLTPTSHGDEGLAQVTTLLGRAERDYQLGRLLSELAHDAVGVAIDAPLALLEGADPAGLTQTQWRELPAEAWRVLEAAMQVDTKAVEALRVGLKAYGAQGSVLVMLIASLTRQWHAYHRARWSHDFGEPTSLLQRIQLSASRLDSLLADMIFNQAPAAMDATIDTMTWRCANQDTRAGPDLPPPGL